MGGSASEALRAHHSLTRVTLCDTSPSALPAVGLAVDLCGLLTCTPVSSRGLRSCFLEASLSDLRQEEEKPFPLRNHLSSFTPGPGPLPGSRWWAKGQEPVWLPFFCTSYTSLLTVGHLFFSPLLLCPKSVREKMPFEKFYYMKNNFAPVDSKCTSITMKIILK